MLKNLALIGIISFFLVSCNWKEIENNTNNETSDDISYETFLVGANKSIARQLNANVISNNLLNITSSKAWIITYLNCNNWQHITKWEYIAKIVPDYNDSSMKTLINQKKTLNDQLNNTITIKNSTLSSLDIQVSNLKTQKLSVSSQLSYSKDNLKKMINQKWLTSNDLELQTKNLEKQLLNLKDQKKILENSKLNDNEKLISNISNIKNQIYNTSNDAMSQIDKVFGITATNRYKNDSFENFLSAKDTSLKNDIEKQFEALLKIQSNQIDNDALNIYMQNLSDLLNLASDATKKSATSSSFTQTQIDTYDALFLWLSNNILTLKTNFETLTKSLQTTTNTYDSQISILSNSIQSITINLQNLKDNQTENNLLNLDINITNLKSAINGLENQLTATNNQVSSMGESKNAQQKQFDNQILSIKQSINSINLLLAEEKLFAIWWWTVKIKPVSLNNKIWPTELICQIIPDNTNTLKLQIFSPNKIEAWTKYTANQKDQTLFSWTFAEALPYKDNFSQNFIHEITLQTPYWLKIGDKLTISIFSELTKAQKKIISIPINYIIPNLNGYYTKIITWSNKPVRKQIEIGEINGNFVQILSGLKIGDTIVK